MDESTPALQFVAIGLLLIFLNYFGRIPGTLWLPLLRSPSMMPGLISSFADVAVVAMVSDALTPLSARVFPQARRHSSAIEFKPVSLVSNLSPLATDVAKVQQLGLHSL